MGSEFPPAGGRAREGGRSPSQSPPHPASPPAGRGSVCRKSTGSQETVDKWVPSSLPLAGGLGRVGVLRRRAHPTQPPRQRGGARFAENRQARKSLAINGVRV